jgi:hypothetical protein
MLFSNERRRAPPACAHLGVDQPRQIAHTASAPTSRIASGTPGKPAVAGAPPPGAAKLRRLDPKLGHVAGHHVGLRNAAHQEPHDHALRPHRHGGEGARDDACQPSGPFTGGPASMRKQKTARKSVSSASIHGKASWPLSRASPINAAAEAAEERDDVDHFAGEADVIDDKLGAGSGEASGRLRHEQPEQGEKRVAVDVPGGEV